MFGQTTRQESALTAKSDAPIIALLVLAVVAAFVLMHPYEGITHDARLYTLQALNFLHPDLYGNDIFLRFGSQDDYTIFSPLYASVISWMGIEAAAMILTLVSQLTFLAAALLLARTLMPAGAALTTVLLLLLLPDHYGATKMFSYLEAFVTPRLLAESFVLFGLATWLRGWRKGSVLLLVCAMLIHPIMGLAGVAAIASQAFIVPRWRILWPLALVAVLAIGAWGVAGWIPAHWQFDAEWLDIVLGRANYLILTSWSSDDWGRVATITATLAIATRILPDEMKRLALATLISTGAMMMVALIGGDLLHVKLVLQAQPWRALWLSTVVAVLVLPPIFQRCWSGGNLQRTGVTLLAAAWFLPAENLALLIAPMAIVAVALSHLNMGKAYLRLLPWGACAVLAMVLIHAWGVSWLTWQVGAYGTTVSPSLDALRSLSIGGAVPMCVFFGGWWVARKAPRRTIPALSACLLLAIPAAAWPTARTWIDTRYSVELKAAFHIWRERIPPGVDVMWAADSLTGEDGATNTWLLLERPSFVSRIQTTTSLFSREAAIAIHQRTTSLLGLLPDIGSLYPKNTDTAPHMPLALAPVCRTTSVRYIVTHETFNDATPLDAPRNVRQPFRNLKLYICP